MYDSFGRPFPPISVKSTNKWKCFALPRAVERVGERLWTSVSAFWVGNVWTVKRLHECLLSLYLLLATALLLHRHHRPLFLLLLSFFPWCSGLLIAVLAADVADGRLSSRAGRQSVPLLLLPRWPPQLLVGVGRRAAGKDGHSQTELTSLRARTDEPSRRTIALTAAGWFWVAGRWGPGWCRTCAPAGGWCVRSWRRWPQSSSPSHTTGQTCDRISTSRAQTGNAEHTANLDQWGLQMKTRWEEKHEHHTGTHREPAGLWKQLQPELWSSCRRSLTHSLRYKRT